MCAQTKVSIEVECVGGLATHMVRWYKEGVKAVLWAHLRVQVLEKLEALARNADV